MRGFLFSAASALLMMVPATTNAENDVDVHEMVDKIDSVVVSSSRAGKSTPVTFSTVSSKELRASNPINSLPMLLGFQPSVITSNEGGTGLGYSKLSVRGSKGSQINVTLNGITLNDAESQEVFWVNIPSLTNILNSVQLQRGLGTTANGAGAFGASINMSSASVGTKPFAMFDLARGSWNTFTSNVSVGTGLLPSGLYFNASYSKNTTDGYIRNAYADVQSAFAVLGWLKSNNSLKFTWLMGDQKSGITWNGEPYSNYQEGDYKYNASGEYYDEFGNVKYYGNETDNYNQHHLQLNYTHLFSEALAWTTTVNYTNGYGYDDQYKAGKKFSKYGFSSPQIGQDGESYSKGDFIIKKIMDNSYYVANSTLKYTTDKLVVNGGVYLSTYNGDHFGKVLWSNVLGDSYNGYGKNWYDNVGKKKELNLFLRAEWQPLEFMTAYADLQYRGVSLDMTGKDDDEAPLDYNNKWNFFNPRAGVTFQLTEAQKVYASVSMGHREPGRADLKENIKSVLAQIAAGEKAAEVSLKSERMIDVEVGYSYSTEKFTGNANIYLMEYKNMLLETGKLSTSGYAIKENVPTSFRRGIELGAAWKPSAVFGADANATFSANKIKDYTAYYAENDLDWNPLGQYSEHYDKVDMLLSPSVIAMGRVAVTPFALVCGNSLKTTTLTLSAKYVGKQYWDNTGSADRQIPGYFVTNLSLTHEFKLGNGRLNLGAYINNLLNRKYYSDAWVYRSHFNDGSWYQEEGVFPQAPINMMFRTTYSF